MPKIMQLVSGGARICTQAAFHTFEINYLNPFLASWLQIFFPQEGDFETFFFLAIPMAWGGSQAGGETCARVATCPTAMAMPDPYYCVTWELQETS